MNNQHQVVSSIAHVFVKPERQSITKTPEKEVRRYQIWCKKHTYECRPVLYVISNIIRTRFNGVEINQISLRLLNPQTHHLKGSTIEMSEALFYEKHKYLQWRDPELTPNRSVVKRVGGKFDMGKPTFLLLEKLESLEDGKQRLTFVGWNVSKKIIIHPKKRTVITINTIDHFYEILDPLFFSPEYNGRLQLPTHGMRIGRGDMNEEEEENSLDGL